jgi:hypothetical protein
MKGHAGAVLTAGFAAIALALVTLQAMVLTHGIPKQQVTAVRSGNTNTNRYSVPGGRSGIPWVPFDKAAPVEKTPLPEDPEGRKPPAQRQEQHQSPPPSRFRSAPPHLGPQRPRSAVA